MNRSSLRNERLKFETLGKDLPIVLEESSEYPRMRDKKTKRRSRHVTDGTWRESDLDHLCPRNSRDSIHYYYFKYRFGDSRKKTLHHNLCMIKVEVDSITKELLKRV